jgi:hypothetical protein
MMKKLWLGFAQFVAVGLVVWLLFSVSGSGSATGAPGTAVELALLRDGTQQVLRVRVGKRPAPQRD